MSKLFNISFDVKLLEDMHSGSGLGYLKIIDDMQARDGDGHPVVWGTTFKGILRDIAEELYNYNLDFCSKNQIIRIFGTEGVEKSNIICKALHFTNIDEKRILPEFSLRFSSAREIHSRSAKDNSLRCIEMASSGLTANGNIQLKGNDADREFVELLLHKVTNIGAQKSRGNGKVSISNIKNHELKVPLELSQKKSKQIRLLLRTVNPISCPSSAITGNIINSTTFIHGSKMRGALLTVLSDLYGEKIASDFRKMVMNDSVIFTNAYPVSGSKDINVNSLPIPLTSMCKKETEDDLAQSNLKIPWWANDTSDDYWLPSENSAQLDIAELDKNERLNLVGYKRLKSEDFLLLNHNSVDKPPLKIKTPMISLLKNRVPVVRSGRKEDLRRCNVDSEKLIQDKGSLFSTEAIIENQYFVADILIKNIDNNYSLPDLLESLNDLPVNNRPWLRIGRGGQPVEIADVAFYNEIKGIDYSKTNETKNSFYLTLTSDLILRAANLNFKNQLEISDLINFAGLETDVSSSCEITESYCEQIQIRAFNSSASCFEPVKLGLKRGSVFKIQGDVNKLKEKLIVKAKQGFALGEDTDVGYGRFAIDLPVHFSSITHTWRHPSKNVESVNNLTDWQEKIREIILKLDWKKFKKLSKSQLNFFKGQVELCKTVHDIEALLKRLENHSKKKAGVEWKGKSKLLRERLDDKEIVDINAPKLIRDKLYLDTVARYLLIIGSERKEVTNAKL